MTKLKLDENLGKSIKNQLYEKGFNVDDVYEEKIQGAEDSNIFIKCVSDGRCLVTLDTDFCNILRFPYDKSEGIIVLRPYGTLTPFLLKEMVGGMVRALAENEVKGKLWIIEPGRIRIHEPFEQ
jgi:predicted nuclease of predicted toxin-antitoxin system